ncbi:protein FAR1-RELATED SEQUENCE 5-like [Nymphaea colorata]|nr:protein FAR1-RELATED SEQUENCE 5-like [Nymphaea colorata]XP_031473147.1 protein FAR1-RELATED SEQUENCE 5-like [Nymphaea colorata]XP_031473148.1 protein FAR1-RELATED SEQUENCE 5-like [Nymphaea colorata]XP_031473150.1 protein FAR1-RELATED SEQUENCE 5-like [Nymphaea colorata]
MDCGMDVAYGMGEDEEMEDNSSGSDHQIGGDDYQGGNSGGRDPRGNWDDETEVNSGGGDLSTSEGSAILEPYEGMEFDSEEAAKKFYNAYARRMGFSVRIGSTSRSVQDRSIIGRYFVCSKEGFRQKKAGDDEDKVLKRKRLITREGCKAKLAVRKNSIGKWIVRIFIKEHNHAMMTPSTVQYLRSHKRLSSAAQSLNDTQMAVGVRANLMMSFLRLEAGRSSNVGFIERDCKNYVTTVRQRTLGKGDAQAVLDYFKRMQARNPTFFYAIQVDEEEHMTNFFWVDGRSRMAYDHFGDVVTFDTTYKTNKYKMPFAPFAGLNHHRQTVLFGCALLLDESESSFVWLFTTWLEAMCGRHPTAIITNQDPAIEAALARVFPNSRHRLCMWHILRKVPEKLSHVYHAHKSFKDEFYRCIHNTETIDEFEESWGFLVDRYDLREHEWIQSLYDIRHRWVPVYFRNTFFADMNTTQRIILFFHGFLNSNTSLQEFVMQYAKAVESRYEKEMHSDFETNYMQPILKTQCPMEEEAARIYTRTMFLKFQEELVESLAYIVEEKETDGVRIAFRVTRYDQEKREHIVRLDAAKQRATCTCQMFESSGILCKHVLIVFRMNNILTLPPHYILKRFTKNAKSDVVVDGSGIEIQRDNKEFLAQRYTDLCQRAIKLVEDGMASVESYRMAILALDKAFEDIGGGNKAPVAVTDPPETSQTEKGSEASKPIYQTPANDSQPKAGSFQKMRKSPVNAPSVVGFLQPVGNGINGRHWHGSLGSEGPRLSIGIPTIGVSQVSR